MHYAQLVHGDTSAKFPTTMEEAMMMRQDTTEKAATAVRTMKVARRVLQEFAKDHPELQRTTEQTRIWEMYCESYIRWVFYSARTRQYEILVNKLPREAELGKRATASIYSFPMDVIEE